MSYIRACQRLLSSNSDELESQAVHGTDWRRADVLNCWNLDLASLGLLPGEWFQLPLDSGRTVICTGWSRIGLSTLFWICKGMAAVRTGAFVHASATLNPGHLEHLDQEYLSITSLSRACVFAAARTHSVLSVMQQHLGGLILLADNQGFKSLENCILHQSLAELYAQIDLLRLFHRECMCREWKELRGDSL